MIEIPFGPCYGAIRAFKLAIEFIIEHKTVYYTEPILHNRDVMAMLNAEGTLIQAEIEDVPTGQPYIISAHGAPPRTYLVATERRIKVCDLTCQHIKNIQSRMKSEINDGGSLFIIGVKRHQEIMALAAYNHPNPTYIIEDASDLQDLHQQIIHPVKVQIQSTIPAIHVKEIIDEIEIKYSISIESSDKDLCHAIRQRIDYINQLPESQKTIYVLGSHTSQNTRTLMKATLMVGKTPVLVNAIPMSHDQEEPCVVLTATSYLDKTTSTQNYLTKNV
jgi:4-hydroxy-3-methylbut-2-enyl diphosphate reductase